MNHLFILCIETLRNKLAVVLQKAYMNMDLDTASRYFAMSETDLVPGTRIWEGYCDWLTEWILQH